MKNFHTLNQKTLAHCNILIDSYNFGNSKETLNNLEKLINYIENENYEEILEFSKKIKTH